MSNKTMSVLIAALVVFLGIYAAKGFCEEKDEGIFLEIGDSIKSQEDADEEEASMPFFQGEMLDEENFVPVPENIDEIPPLVVKPEPEKSDEKAKSVEPVEKKPEAVEEIKVNKPVDKADKEKPEEKKEEQAVLEDIKEDMPPLLEQMVEDAIKPEKKVKEKPAPAAIKPKIEETKKIVEKKKEEKKTPKPPVKKEKKIKKESAPKAKKKEKALEKKPKKKKREVKKPAKKKGSPVKLPDLVIEKVVSRVTNAGNKRELLITIKNTGDVSAPPQEHGENIIVIVKTGGGPATRQMRLQRQISPNGKIVVSSGKYPKRYVDGKKVMIMINYTGKEKKRENNIWNKPALKE